MTGMPLRKTFTVSSPVASNSADATSRQLGQHQRGVEAAFADRHGGLRIGGVPDPFGALQRGVGQLGRPRLVVADPLGLPVAGLQEPHRPRGGLAPGRLAAVLVPHLDLPQAALARGQRPAGVGHGDRLVAGHPPCPTGRPCRWPARPSCRRPTRDRPSAAARAGPTRRSSSAAAPLLEPRGLRCRRPTDRRGIHSGDSWGEGPDRCKAPGQSVQPPARWPTTADAQGRQGGNSCQQEQTPKNSKGRRFMAGTASSLEVDEWGRIPS